MPVFIYNSNAANLVTAVPCIQAGSVHVWGCLACKVREGARNPFQDMNMRLPA